MNINQSCGTCHFSVFAESESFGRYKRGLCNYPLMPSKDYQLPDSAEVRKVSITADQGTSCPVYEPKSK